LDTGAITFAFMYRKAMYFIPVIMILKMLADENTSDREIHASLTRGAYKNNTAFDKYVTSSLERSIYFFVRF